MRCFVRHNALGLFFAAIFLAALIGEALVGHADYDQQQIASGLATVSLGRYLTSSTFAVDVDVAENWQSEYLQFLLYVLATVWLLQRGSPESKSLDNAGRESDEEQLIGEHARPDSPRWARYPSGWRLRIYSSSLLLVMGGIFVASWLVQSIAGWAAFNETRLQQLQDPIGWGAYVLNPDFWSRTLQNWQSEFLAGGSVAVQSIYLRPLGSPESHSVGPPPVATCH